MQKVYKLSPESNNKLERTFYSVLLPIFLLAMVGGIYIGSQQATLNFFTAAVIMLIVGYAAFNSRKSLDRQKKSWGSYRLTIDENSITRTQNGYENIEIPKEGISKIIEYPESSLVVQAETLKKQIVIPASLERYWELRSVLNQWQSIAVQQSFRKINIIIMFLIAVLSLIGLGIFVLGQDKVLVAVVGLVLAIAIIGGAINIKHSDRLDKHTKKVVKWTFLPLVLIIIRIYSVIF